jgi:hypothetical protein
MKTQTSLYLVLSLLFFTSLNSWAENSTSFPGFTVHHNAISTDTLSPEIASQYHIQRSKYRGLLNVSVIQSVPGTTGKPMEAIVMAKATNIRGQMISIPMRKIVEQDAIYYIGEFRIADQETLNFEVSVKPRGETRFQKVKLSQQFFID